MEPPADERYAEALPAPTLGPFVECYWTSRGHTPRARRVLPDGCADLIVDRRTGRVRVVGTMRRALTVEPGPRDLIAVRFRPGGAHALLHLPMPDLVDTAESFADVVNAPMPGADLADLDSFLQGRLHALRQADQRAALWAGMCADGGETKVSAIADRIGVTRQHLRRAVLRATGVGPKLLARIGRVRRTAEAIASGHAADADTAVAQGFYDQAHMVNEFRDLAGTTPGAYADDVR